MPTNILMPALSPTMEEGKLAKWLVTEGDEVHSGDILAEIETDKATMEFEAVDEGRIGKILVPEGTEGVKINQPIAILLGEGEGNTDIEAVMSSINDAVQLEAKKPMSAQVFPPSTPAGPQAERTKPSAPEHPSRIFASPLARKVAEQKGVDLASLKGSGPRGRIVKADVESAQPDAKAPAKPALATQASASAVISSIASLPDPRLFFKEGDYEEIPHDTMRKAIARRLTAAKAMIPHFYLTIDCCIDELLDTRARLNAAAPKQNGYKLSVNDFVVKAAAAALLRVPEVNASWTDNAILRHKHADIGVAVALDLGLITPIVFRAEEKGLSAISGEMKALAERARAKKLKPQEFEGGTFAISNLGMFGIRDFTAVINPPQAAILAVGAGEARALVRDGKLEVASVMTVTMSCDHRVVDGATGARFLQAFKMFIEDPATMLL